MTHTISFDSLLRLITTTVLQWFNQFFDIIRHVTILNISITWWFVSIAVLGVLFQLLFVKFKDD